MGLILPNYSKRSLSISTAILPTPDHIRAIETQIISLLHQRDKEAISLIFQHYGKVLLGNIARIVRGEEVAKDVLQEVLVKIWKNGPTYDPKKGRLFTWMLNISRNAAIDKIRTKEFRIAQNIQKEDSHVSVTNHPDSAYHMPIDHIGLSAEVAKLEPKYVEVIDFIYFKGYSQSEAAKALDIPLGTLKTRVRYAVNELRKRLSS